MHVREAWREWTEPARPRLWGWDSPNFLLVYAIATVSLWAVVVARAVDLVVGRDRRNAAIAFVVCLPVAVVMTTLAVGYVLRPVEDDRESEPEPPSPETLARGEAERRAWRSR